MQTGFQTKTMDDAPADKSCVLPNTDGTTPVLVYLEFSFTPDLAKLEKRWST